MKTEPGLLARRAEWNMLLIVLVAAVALGFGCASERPPETPTQLLERRQSDDAR